MLKHSLFVRLEAKAGKEDEVAALLQQGLQLANQETTTPLWFALRFGARLFRIGLLSAGARPSLREVMRQARLQA